MQRALWLQWAAAGAAGEAVTGGRGKAWFEAAASRERAGSQQPGGEPAVCRGGGGAVKVFGARWGPTNSPHASGVFTGKAAAVLAAAGQVDLADRPIVKLAGPRRG